MRPFDVGLGSLESPNSLGFVLLRGHEFSKSSLRDPRRPESPWPRHRELAAADEAPDRPGAQACSRRGLEDIDPPFTCTHVTSAFGNAMARHVVPLKLSQP